MSGQQYGAPRIHPQDQAGRPVNAGTNMGLMVGGKPYAPPGGRPPPMFNAGAPRPNGQAATWAGRPPYQPMPWQGGSIQSGVQSIQQAQAAQAAAQAAASQAQVDPLAQQAPTQLPPGSY